MPSKTGRLTRVTICAENWDNTTNFGKGLLCLYMKELPPSPGADQYKRVAITSDHPAFAQIVNAATSAQSRGATVELAYLESHNTRANSWDFGVLNVNS